MTRVAVVHNSPTLPPDHPDAASEADVVHVAQAVADALNARGFSARTFGASPPLERFVADLTGDRPELVFNLVEGFAGHSRAATYLTGIFDLLKIPYTGSSVECFALCVSKQNTKALLRGNGLPTASALRLEPSDPIPTTLDDGPWFVKPDDEDGSLGIDQGSVVVDPHSLAQRIARLRAEYGGPILVERYLPGPEFNVGIFADPEPHPLAIAQVMFAPAEGRWPILTYAAKWHEGSAEDLESPISCPATIDPILARTLGDLALKAFHATGCRDYARVDFRLDYEGRPMILEVNPNPGLDPAAGWARAARVSGHAYGDAIASIARSALARG